MRAEGALGLGLAAAAAVTGAIAAAGVAEHGDGWGPFNDTSHILLGEARSDVRGFDPVATLLGLGLNAAAIVGWAALYRLLFARPRFPASVLTAAAFTAATYVLDYHVFPPRVRPGFERRLSRTSIYLIYAAMGLAFCLADGAGGRPGRSG
jgi:hypothetical protein